MGRKRCPFSFQAVLTGVLLAALVLTAFFARRFPFYIRALKHTSSVEDTICASHSLIM